MYYQKQPRHARDACSLHVQNIEGRVNLNIGCRIVEYLRPRANTWVRAFYYNNINRPDGATFSQTVYVPKYSPRAQFLRLLDVNV